MAEKFSVDNSAKLRLDIEIVLLRKIALLMYEHSNGKMNEDYMEAMAFAKIWHKRYGKNEQKTE